MKTFLSIVVISLNVFISSYRITFGQNQTQTIQEKQNPAVSQPPQFESLGLYLLQKKGGSVEQEYRKFHTLFADAAKAVQITTNSKSVEPFEFLGKITLKNLRENPRYLGSLQESEAFTLPLKDITVNLLKFMNKKGICLLDSMWLAFSNLQTMKFSSAFLSDAIVIGTVIDIKNDSSFADAYRTSVVIKIDEVLKGDYKSNEIIVIRKYGQTSVFSDGSKVYTSFQSHEFIPQNGHRYLFNLSKTSYEKRVIRPLGNIINGHSSRNYIRYDNEIEQYRKNCFEGSGTELKESEINIARLACQKYYQLKNQYNSEK